MGLHSVFLGFPKFPFGSYKSYDFIIFQMFSYTFRTSVAPVKPSTCQNLTLNSVRNLYVFLHFRYICIKIIVFHTSSSNSATTSDDHMFSHVLQIAQQPPRASQSHPRAAQELPRAAQEQLRTVQKPPGTAQEPPRTAQEPPNSRIAPPKSRPRPEPPKSKQRMSA